MGTCKVQIKHKNKQVTCEFFVVHGNGLASLGMTDIKLLDILSIKCSTIDLLQRDRDK